MALFGAYEEKSLEASVAGEADLKCCLGVHNIR